MKIVVIANIGERTCLRVVMPVRLGPMAPRRGEPVLLNGSHLLAAPFRPGAERSTRGACATQSEE
jgi:hypothetical protein